MNVKSLEEIRWLAGWLQQRREEGERERKSIYTKSLFSSRRSQKISLSLSLSSFAAGNFVSTTSLLSESVCWVYISQISSTNVRVCASLRYTLARPPHQFILTRFFQTEWLTDFFLQQQMPQSDSTAKSLCRDKGRAAPLTPLNQLDRDKELALNSEDEML